MSLPPEKMETHIQFCSKCKTRFPNHYNNCGFCGKELDNREEE